MSKNSIKRFGARRMTAEEIFLAYSGVTSESGCMPWQGSVMNKGYGDIRAGGGSIRRIYAHRYAWTRANGAIPEGMMVCHTCDNRQCVNVEHLFLGTARDNTDDMVSKNRHQKGEQRPMAKVTETQVRKMRADYESGIPQRLIAERNSISKSAVSLIVRRKRWSHV